MPPKKKTASSSSSKTRATHDADSVVATLRKLASERVRADMTKRYGIPNHNAFGVPMGKMIQLAKELGRDHALAQSLWGTANYEARTVAALVDDPALVTTAQMDRWAKDFDSWAICDTVCFKLFDRVPGALKKVQPWSKKRGEFEKRAAFALLACVALHDKEADDAAFLKYLPLCERAASDERNFVKKGVLWALRGIARRGPKLHAATVAVAKRLAESTEPPARWIGKSTLRELARSA
ncbi:MAG: DNA alkylation repair protein [Planctomycetota bacterium]